MNAETTPTTTGQGWQQGQHLQLLPLAPPHVAFSQAQPSAYVLQPSGAPGSCEAKATAVFALLQPSGCAGVPVGNTPLNQFTKLAQIITESDSLLENKSNNPVKGISEETI